MARRPPPGKVIKAQLNLTPESVRRFEHLFIGLKRAVRDDIIDQALMAGAEIVKKYQMSNAPGPHIEIQFIRSIDKLKKGRASGLIKKNLGDARYVAIGPDKEHWYYTFVEHGTRAHGSTRKYTHKDKKRLGKIGRSFAGPQNKEKRRAMRKEVYARKGRAMMTWTSNGRSVFARQVSGIAKKAFVYPAVDDHRDEISKAMWSVLLTEIEKAAKG